MPSTRRPATSRAMTVLLVALCITATFLTTAPAQAATGVPSAPLDVVATVGAGRSVTVTWNPPTDGGTSPLKSYTVTVSPGVATATVPVGSPRTKKLDLGSVPATTQLSVTVTANNAVGDGPASTPTPTFTIPATAPDPATAITVSAAQGDPTISWTLGRTGGSPITASTLTIQPGDRVIAVDGDQHEAVVPGLQPGTKYTVAVVVSNAVGNSAPAYGAAFTPWAAPGRIGTVRAVRGYQSAAIAWSKPVTHGRAVSLYRVTVMPGGGTFTVPGTTTSAKLTGLQNGTRYTATIAPIIGSSTFPGTTSPGFVPAGKPGPPYVLAVKAKRGKVVLRWAAAFTNGDPVRRYQLQTSTGVYLRDIDPTDRRIVVKLRRGTMVKFRMRSVNGVGKGPWGGWTQTVRVR